MEPRRALAVDQIQLSELAFWTRPLEEREGAFATLREGVAAEDGLVYDEPPGWMLPVRHALGALLMSAGRYAEAEEVYLAFNTKAQDQSVVNAGRLQRVLGLGPAENEPT